MNKNILALLQKIADSEELQAQFEKLDTPDAAYELAGKIQQGFTKEEFLDAMTALNEAGDGDVSDEELAATAGGADVEPEETWRDLVPKSLSKAKITISRPAESNMLSKVLISRPGTRATSAAPEAGGQD